MPQLFNVPDRFFRGGSKMTYGQTIVLIPCLFPEKGKKVNVIKNYNLFNGMLTFLLVCWNAKMNVNSTLSIIKNQ